jgi:hypothetical protein
MKKCEERSQKINAQNERANSATNPNQCWQDRDFGTEVDSSELGYLAQEIWSNIEIDGQ